MMEDNVYIVIINRINIILSCPRIENNQLVPLPEKHNRRTNKVIGILPVSPAYILTCPM